MENTTFVASTQVFLQHAPSETNTPASLTDSVALLLDNNFGVELLLHEFDGSPWSVRTLDQLREMCQTPLPITAHAWINEYQPKVLQEEIRLAASVGASQMVIHPYVLNVYPDNRPVAFNVVRDICSFANDCGIVLALENLGALGIEGVQRIIDVVGLDITETGLGVCIDTGHALRSQTLQGTNPVDFFEYFRDIIVELHINDNFGTDDIHIVPGTGSINWDTLFPQFNQLNAKTQFCLELKTVDDPLPALQSARDFIVNGLAKYSA